MTSSSAPLNTAGQPLPKRWLAAIAAIFIGQAFSLVTSYAAGWAIIWHVTETTGSALMLAAASVCACLPQGLISPFGGVVADRCNRKTTMVIADLGIGLFSLAVGAAVLFGEPTFPLLMVLVVARSIGQAFHGPAMMASLPLLVPERHLLRINSLSQTLMSLAAIGSPALGILLYTAFGLHAAMFLDFGGALLAVLGLSLAKIPSANDEAAQSQHVLANLRDGWHAIVENRGLTILIAVLIGGGMVMAPWGTVFPLMTYDHFGGSGFDAALVEALWGGGMLAGSIILMAWGGDTKLVRLIAFSIVGAGTLTSICGLLPSSQFALFATMTGLSAIICAWFNGPFMTIIQRTVAPEKLGRVMGFVTAAAGLLSPLGVAAGGVLAETIGVASFFVVTGICFVLLGAAVYLPESVRAFDRDAADANRNASESSMG